MMAPLNALQYGFIYMLTSDEKKRKEARYEVKDSLEMIAGVITVPLAWLQKFVYEDETKYWKKL